MSLNPLAANFAGVADAYERGRPEYTPVVAETIAAELNIRPGSRVLDLAAGTGKLTRALLAFGLDVVGVEPIPQLRAILGESVGSERVLEGFAEGIPLPDASVAAVTVAEAFHWFDQPRALREIHRVLIEGGGLAAVRIVPDWSGASWAHEVGSILAELGREHPQMQGPRWQDTAAAQGGWTPPRDVTVTMSEPASAAGVLDYISSMSWTAALPDDQRTETIERITELVQAGETPSELSIHAIIGLTSRA